MRTQIALLVAAIELLRSTNAPAWQIPAQNAVSTRSQSAENLILQPAPAGAWTVETLMTYEAAAAHEVLPVDLIRDVAQRHQDRQRDRQAGREQQPPLLLEHGLNPNGAMRGMGSFIEKAVQVAARSGKGRNNEACLDVLVKALNYAVDRRAIAGLATGTLERKLAILR